MGHKFCGQVGNFIEIINRKKESSIFYGLLLIAICFLLFSGMSLEFDTKCDYTDKYGLKLGCFIWSDMKLFVNYPILENY